MSTCTELVDFRGVTPPGNTLEHKKNKAKLKKMVIADPGVGFQLALDMPDYANQVKGLGVTFQLGPRAGVVHHKVTIGLGVPEGLLDLSQDFLFITPFIDPQYGQEVQGASGEYHYQIDIQLYDQENRILLTPETWMPIFQGTTTAEMVKPGQFHLSFPHTEHPPFQAVPPAETQNPVEYSEVLYHPCGLAFRMKLPTVTDGVTNSVGVHHWLNRAPDHNMNFALYASMDEKKTFRMQEHSLVWVPYPRQAGQALPLSSSQINVEVFPQDLGVTHLNLIYPELGSLAEDQVVIEVK